MKLNYWEKEYLTGVTEATLTSTPLLGTISQSQPLKLKYTKLANLTFLSVKGPCF